MIKIFRPLKSNWKTQGFGESLACAKINKWGNLLIPTIIRGKKDGGFCDVGFKDFYKLIGMKAHNGVDHSCWYGEPIYFPVDTNCEWWVRNYTDNDGGKGLDVFSDRPLDIGELPKECGKLAISQYNGTYSEPRYGYEKGKVFVKFRFHHLKKSLLSDSRNNVAGKPEGYRDVKVKFGDLIALGDNTGSSSGSHSHENMKIVANNSGTLDIDNGYYGAVDDTRYTENIFVLDVLKVKQKAMTAIELARRVLFEVQQFLRNKLAK